MPWPGPQVTLLMLILVDPCPIEIQSSPVEMILFDTFTKLELLI